MTTVRLVARMAFRNRARTLIAALGVSLTLVAFLLLRTLVSNWYSTNEEIAKSDQLVVRHKISIAFSLYRRMAEKIRTIPGVQDVSALIWFSGFYKDEKARFGQLAVEGESYFRIYPEYAPSAAQYEAYMADTSGVIVGRDLASKYGWKLGEKVTLTGTIFPGNWDFTVRGIYPGKDGYNRDWLFMHYKRLNPVEEHAHRLVVKAPPGAATAIDAMFANTDTPTKTESEIAVRRSWATWSEAVVGGINLGSGLVLLVLTLVLGNAMAMATRENMREYAAMRAIGYRSSHILAIVLGQGLVISALGIAIALAAVPAVLSTFSSLMAERLGGSWEVELHGRVTAAAVVVALAAGMLATAWPAWRSKRVRIVDALRRIA